MVATTSTENVRRSVADSSYEVFQRVMEVNYLAVVALTKAILPHMLERKGGSGFIVISSVQGKLGKYVNCRLSDQLLM